MALIAVRSHDGSQTELHQADIQSVKSLGDLRRLIAHVLDIPIELLIIMHTEGWQIDDQALPLLLEECRTVAASGYSKLGGGSNTSNSSSERLPRIWAFNRDFLDADLEQLQHELAIQDNTLTDILPLPAFARGYTAAQVAAQHTANARNYHDITMDLLRAISNQRTGLGVALANLRRHYTGKMGGVEAFELFASPLLADFRELLESYDACIGSIQRIKVHPAILTVPSERPRTLHDFVSREKISAVKESCSRLNADLQTRFLNLRSLLTAVARGSDELQGEFDANDQDDLQDAARDAHEAWQRVQDIAAALPQMRDQEEFADALAELGMTESETRERTAYLISRRQATLDSLLITLQQIASLQSSLSTAPQLLNQLNEDLRNPKLNDQFKHLARLRGMVPAYASTVIEIVRRRRYGALLVQHSQNLGDVLGKLSSAETKRRATYRQEANGRLPWEIRGLDESVAIVEVDVKRPQGDGTVLPDLVQKDIEELISVLDELEQIAGSDPVREARAALERALTRLEALEADFERASANGAASAPLPSDLEQQLQDLRARHAALEGELQAERDLSRMREAELAGSRADLSVERRKSESLMSDLAIAKRLAERDLEIERKAGLKQRDRIAALDGDLKGLREQFASLEHRLYAETKRASELEAHLSSSKGQAEEANRREEELNETVSRLRDELHSTNKQADSLDTQLAAARSEIVAERQRADDATAQLAPLQVLAETATVGMRELKDQVADLETRRAGAANEAAETQAALREADRSRHSLRTELERHKSESKAALAQARKALKLAKSLNDFNAAATHQLMLPSSVEENNKLDKSPSTMMIVSQSRSPSPDWDHLDAAALDKWQHSMGGLTSSERLNTAIADKINSLNATTRKWQKECKAYRDRTRAAVAAAGEKIAFRHFGKGDLALFLPTRNSTAQIWAAFNFCFPHYFLSATCPAAELTKTREYVIARILGVTECTVDPKDPTSNPFGLASGTKYWLLEAESWSPSARHRKSLSVEKKKTDDLPATAQRSVSMPSGGTLGQSSFSLVNRETKESPTVLERHSASVSTSPVRLTSSNLTRALAASSPISVAVSAPAVEVKEGDASTSSAPLSSSPAFLPSGKSRPSGSVVVASVSPRYGHIGRRTPSQTLSANRRPSAYPASLSTSPPGKTLSTTSTTFTYASVGSDEAPPTAGEAMSGPLMTQSVSQLGASALLKQFNVAVNELTPTHARKSLS